MSVSSFDPNSDDSCPLLLEEARKLLLLMLIAIKLNREISA